MNIRPKPNRSHRGAVLILVLVMLALLAMLAISLATTSALDRNTSHNYIDEVRARLVAKAGVEYAITRVTSMIQRGKFEDPSMTYWGNKLVEDGEPDWLTPLIKAQNPSFAVEDENPQNPDDEKVMPILFKFEDRDVGISGTMSSNTYGVHSDVYRLRVADCNSRLNVNDGLDDPDVTKNLTRILNHLGAACKVKEAGERLIAKRPRIGYRTRKELKAILGEEDFVKLGHHLTTYAWKDPNVVNPVPLSQTVLGAYPVDYNKKIALYRYGRSRTSDGVIIDRQLSFAPDYTSGNGFDHAVMGMDELNAQWISRTSRSPVNVNAASVEILTALISDLRGFFMTERRKKNPGGGEYTFMFYPKHTNMPGASPIGAEVGYLYATPKFIGPAEESSGTGGSEGSVSARVIADEIVACRTGGRSKVGGFDYGSAWYGGSFRSWRQFYAFCDDLVARGILADGRAIYFDYTPTDGGGGGWFSGDCGADTLVPSPSQPKVAAQAMADVLKANFNPNCSLNDLNPDRNLYLEVDKTDLICNSTEFCFTPMGFFEIECEGLIIKTPRGDDLMRARMGMIQARETIECVVKVYDVYRETTQSDFCKGDLGLDVRRLMTNSNKPLELGPEPQAGENPEECKWSGWIQLSTIGGIRRPPEKNAVMSTPKSKDPEQGSSAFGHFQFDHRLNYHASDQQHPLQFSGGFGNQPDRTEQHAGPYNPTRGGRGEFRLARDYTAAEPPPNTDYKAMSDLRIDGAYIERDGALLYPCTPEVFATDGTIAFWLKPAFKPSMTGKPRTFFSTDTFIEEGGSMQQGWQLINGLWFFAAHDHMAYTSSPNEFASPAYADGPWRPVCICSGYATRGSYGGGVGHQTPSLNHTTHVHGGGSGQPPVGNIGDIYTGGPVSGGSSAVEAMEHHQWMHVAYEWDMSGHNVKIMVNGVTYQGPEVLVHPQPTTAADWTSENAVFRLGEPSSTMSYGGSRNWTVDGTMDEFYMWKGGALDTASQLFDRGRYHVPRFGQEGFYTSQPILHNVIHGQRFPEPTTARPPMRAREPGAGRTQSSGTQAVPKNQDVMRPICAFWTWYGQAMNSDKIPVIFDYSNWPEAPDALKVQVSLQLLLDGEPAGPALMNDGGAPIENVSVRKEQKFQYQLKLFLPDAAGASILLGTPIIDDVTIFYTQGIEYIHYNRIELE